MKHAEDREITENQESELTSSNGAETEYMTPVIELLSRRNFRCKVWMPNARC